MTMTPAEGLARIRAKIAQFQSAGRPIPGELTDLLQEFSDKLEAFEAVKRAHPLRYAELWAPECPTCPHPNPHAKAPVGSSRRGQPLKHLRGLTHECPACGAVTQRTSQLAAVRAMLNGEINISFVLGGNRTGKTEAGAQIAVAFALGAAHPDVQAWAKLNKLDISRIQRGPGRVWSIAQTFELSRTICRSKLDKYLPQGTHRRSWEADGPAEALLPGGGYIGCKAFKQGASENTGHNPFEGAAIHMAWCDEEPTSEKAVESIKARLIDANGFFLQTFTPLTGWTPYLKRSLAFLHDGLPTPQGVNVLWLHGEDNPHVSAEVIRRTFGAGTPQSQAARMRGEIVPMEGAVHPDFSRQTHIIAAFEPPSGWPRIRATDWGSRAPFATVWMAYDSSQDQVHVFHEVYKAGLLLSEAAQLIWAYEGCPACQPQEFGSDDWMRWRVRIAQNLHKCDQCQGSGFGRPVPVVAVADPEGRDQRGVFASSYDLPTGTAMKARSGTFDELFRRMKPARNGPPGLVFHDSCPETIREFERLVWDKAVKMDFATKGPDHAHDCVRYGVWEFKRQGYTPDMVPVAESEAAK